MATNIEKLCEEINAMQEEDPQFFTAALSEEAGGKRLYLDVLMAPVVTGYIDFETVLPFDQSGRPGTTDDVYTGATLCVTVADDPETRPEVVERLRKVYPLSVYFNLNDAARAGKISSKILAEWPITREQRLERARNHRHTVKKYKEDVEKFISEQDPATQNSLRENNAQVRTAWKTKKQSRRKKPPKK